MSDLRIPVGLDTPKATFARYGFEVAQMPEFPGYVVATDGSVFSSMCTPGRNPYYKKLSGHVKQGYRLVTFCNATTQLEMLVHRAVAGLFIPNPDNLPIVRHLNGKRLDNRLANLSWGTAADNENDKHAHGTWDLRRNGKLRQDQVVAIREMARNGVPYAQIALGVGVHSTTVSRAATGSTWDNVK